MLATMVGQQRKILKLQWLKCPKKIPPEKEI